jgi:hypothetical protein
MNRIDLANAGVDMGPKTWVGAGDRRRAETGHPLEEHYSKGARRKR